MITERSEIARDRKGGGTAAHERNSPAVLDGRGARQAVPDVVLVIGRDALEAADRDGFLLDAPAPAGRLARTIASTSEDAGEYVRLPIDHVGVAVAARRDQSDIFGNRRVSRAGPLTIHDLVEIVWRRNVGGFHLLLCTTPPAPQSCADPRRACIRAPVWEGAPNPARILVDPPSKFHRYVTHNSGLSHRASTIRAWLPLGRPRARESFAAAFGRTS